MKTVVLFRAFIFSLSFVFISCSDAIDNAKVDYLLADGQANFNNQNWAEAISSLNRVLEIDPENSYALLLRSLSLRYTGDYDSAFKDAKLVEELFPEDPKVHYVMSQLHKEQENYFYAIEALSRAIDLDPTIIIGYINRASLKLDIGDYSGALEDVFLGLKFNPREIALIQLKGSAYVKLGKFEEGMQAFNKMLYLDHNNADAFYGIGYAFDKMEDYESAIENYTKAIEFGSNFHLTYYNRGIAFKRILQYKAAIYDFTRALELKPNDWESLISRGLCHHHLNNLIEAIEDYSQAIEINPMASKAYYNRSQCFLILEFDQKALKDINKAIEIAPYDYNSFNQRALIHISLDNTVDALNDLDFALKIDSLNVMANYNRGALKIQLGKTLEGCKDLNKALELGFVKAWEMFHEHCK